MKYCLLDVYTNGNNATATKEVTRQSKRLTKTKSIDSQRTYDKAKKIETNVHNVNKILKYRKWKKKFCENQNYYYYY